MTARTNHYKLSDASNLPAAGAALTPNAIRQRAFRAKKDSAGLAEVRGLYAPPSLHDPIRAKVAEWLKLGFAPTK